ncbi:MAG: CARDB domain-containing protein, partial [bacterium]
VCPSHIIKQYQRVRITAFVKNIGTAKANNIKLIFLEGSNQINGTKTIGHLAPGEIKIRQVIFKPKTIGTHTITVMVDPSNTIQELREDNNIATTTIFVKPGQGIMGTITDKQTEKPIAGVWVFAIGCDFGMDRTDCKGDYIIEDLRPGCYIVLAIKRGYYPKTKRGIVVNVGILTIVDFSLTKRIRAFEAQESYEDILSLLEKELGEDKGGFNLKAMATLILANQEELEVIDPATPTLTLSSNKETVSPPDEVIISINGEDIGNLSGMEITLNYDQENLKLLKIENGEIFGKIEENNGMLTFIGTSTKDKGLLANIIFKVIGGENLSISINTIDCYDTNYRKVESLSNGIILKTAYPNESLLLPSFPNPTNNSCWIPFKLAEDSYVSFTIYNLTGQKVRTIDVGFRKKGQYTKAKEGSAIFFDGKNSEGEPLSKGLYFYKLLAGEFSDCKAMVIGK